MDLLDPAVRTSQLAIEDCDSPPVLVPIRDRVLIGSYCEGAGLVQLSSSERTPVEDPFSTLTIRLPHRGVGRGPLLP